MIWVYRRPRLKRWLGACVRYFPFFDKHLRMFALSRGIVSAMAVDASLNDIGSTGNLLQDYCLTPRARRIHAELKAVVERHENGTC